MRTVVVIAKEMVNDLFTMKCNRCRNSGEIRLHMVSVKGTSMKLRPHRRGA